VITYLTRGSPEEIDEHIGVVLEQKDVEGIINKIRELKEKSILPRIAE